MLSKNETENEILTKAKLGQQKEEETMVAVLNIRNLDSVHSQDCSCNICKPLRHLDSSPVLEQEQRIKLDYYRP